MLMIEFLEAAADYNDVSVTKFLEDYHHHEEPAEYHDDYSEDEEEEEGDFDYDNENTIMSNDQSIEKNAKKRGKKKKNGKKSKKPFGGLNEDVVFVEFLDTAYLPDAYFLQ